MSRIESFYSGVSETDFSDDNRVPTDVQFVKNPWTREGGVSCSECHTEVHNKCLPRKGKHFTPFTLYNIYTSFSIEGIPSRGKVSSRCQSCQPPLPAPAAKCRRENEKTNPNGQKSARKHNHHNHQSQPQTSLFSNEPAALICKYI